ncbi:MAG: hypothetical protein E7399_09075 [Ruminococcaceae bacterium]|nr:hypothetical protein [Oscillospiraceae bacterium]
MNRVLLCGVCVGAVKSLLGDDCTRVTVMTASDGSVKQKVQLEHCENAQAVLHHNGICYHAKAEFTEDRGVTLPDGSRLMNQSPALVTLLMQNIAKHLTDEGVEVSFSAQSL